MEQLSLIEVVHVSYAYEGSTEPVVDDVSLTLAAGECVALVGRNGSGKSTLARLIRGSLAPTRGEVLVDGHPATGHEAWPLVGMVRQDPSSQMVSSLVDDDVAFGPRNLGLDADAVEHRVDWAFNRVGGASLNSDSHIKGGFPDPDSSFLRGRSVEELSGGQQQLVALADTLALQPRYIVTDEAASQLDLSGRKSFSEVIDGLRKQGVGVLMVSHLLEQIVQASRVALLENGRLIWAGTPWELLASNDLMSRSGLEEDPLAIPLQILARAGFVGTGVRGMVSQDSERRHERGPGVQPVWNDAKPTAAEPIQWESSIPDKAGTDRHGSRLSASDSFTWADAVLFARSTGIASRLYEAVRGALDKHSDESVGHGPALRLNDVTVTYEGVSSPALEGAGLVFEPGQLTLVAGQSGSGKSTLARVLAGVLQPNGGHALLGDKTVRPGDVGLAFQRPEDQLFCSTVLEDVMYGPTNRGSNQEEAQGQAEEALRHLGVPEQLWERSPFELSGGERRRVALAGIVAQGCQAYVFDEPTAGLDGPSRQLLHQVASVLAREGHPVVVVSHDVDEWLPLAHRVVLLREGHVVFAGDAHCCRASAKPFVCAGLPAPTLVWLGTVLSGEQLRCGEKNEREEEGDPEEGGPSRVEPAGHTEAPSAAVESSEGEFSGACLRPASAATGSCESAHEGAAPATTGSHEPRQRRAVSYKKQPTGRIALPVGMYVAKNTPFHRLDARVKVLLVLTLTVAVFAATSPLAVAALLVGVVVAERAAGVSGRALVRTLKPTIVILCFSLLANALRLDGSGDIVLVANVGLSVPGVVRGITAVARIVVVVAGVLVVSASTTGPQIADALGSLLRPLGKFGVRVDDFSLVLSIALRFVPMSVRTFDEIRAAQQARGARFNEGSLSIRLGKWVAVLVPMVVALFRRANELAQAMHDRCYGYAPRTVSRVRLRARDVLVLLAGCAFMAAACMLL